MRELERRVLLSVLDRKWREHLYEMDYLREGIGLRAYSQRDPLVEYQREGFDMFAAMMDGMHRHQLRGRSGRQGDPGETRFYLSLEDELMRLFKSDWVDWVLTTLKVPDDVPIENKRVTGAIAPRRRRSSRRTSTPARTS